MSKMDMQLASGEYAMSRATIERRELDERRQRSEAVSAARRQEREKQYIAPEEGPRGE